MKLKFLSLGLLALSIVACDSYEESESVAAMRNARTEYVVAQTAYKNAQAAYQEAQTAGQLVANAYAEARNAKQIEELELHLEEARLALEEAKAEFEYEIAQQKQNMLNLEDNILTSAYADYTTAYDDWNTTSDNLLTAQNDLVSANMALASANMADVNFVATETAAKNLLVTTQTSELADLNAQLEAYEALQASNEWTTVAEQVAAKKLEKAELKAENDNLMASLGRASVKVNTAYESLEQWIEDYDLVGNVSIDSDKGIIEMAAAFNAHRDALVNDTIAPAADLEAAEANLEAVETTDGSYNVIKEAYDNALVVYNEAIAELNAYNYTIASAVLRSLNSVYVAALNSMEPISDDLAINSAKLDVLSADIDKLEALQFVIDTDVTEGTVDASEKLADLIDDTKSDILVVEKAIVDANDVLTNLEAGNYTQADAVRDAELAIEILETKISKLTAELAVAKTKLDTAEAAYQALLN